jgi:hypothetical protein
MKKILSAVLFVSIFVSCTKDFESLNQNPNQISEEMLLQDNNLLGAPFSNIMFNLFGHQIEEDLCYDSWMGYMNTPTDFVGNVNNTTYYMRWNVYWGRVYGSVMSPSKKIIELAAKYEKPLFADWAKLFRVMSVSKLTAVHGPVIYSNYGSTENSILYDKESDLYNTFFAQLDTIQADFAANTTYPGFAKFDPSYKGSIPAWMKVVNSVRLRLAMRLSKVDRELAKTQGEKALADPAGLIETNADNFKVALLGNIMPVAQICYQWDDTRMGGVIESFMAGYNDGRAAKMFEPTTGTLGADPNHPSFQFKGIRNGAFCGTTKPFMLQYSKVSNDFNSAQNRRAFTASEVFFLKAEAALRGWEGAGDAKENYETAVRLSFQDWGAGGVDAYLADATSKPLNYVDPADARNNFTQPSTVTIAWNAGDNNEMKLEKIITQKYLNTYTNTLEAWVDFRRTGYPKIPHVAKNDSSPDWGVIPADQWIKRMPFVDGERTGNTAAVADAVTKMGAGAKDDIATRLWWDTGGPNF